MPRLAAVTLLLALNLAAADLQFGASTIDITPPVGYRMAGYFSERFSTGTLDPLYAKVLVFKQGDVRAALIVCDLVAVPVEVTAKARELIEKKTGIPAKSIAVAATHTHTGPMYHGVLYNFFKQRAIAEHGSDPHEKTLYTDELIGKLVKAVEQAGDNLRAVSLEYALTQPEPQLPFNRRFHMKDGTVKFNPGQQNPEIVKVAGPIDPDAHFVLFKSGGAPIAGLTGFTMHLDTVGGTLYSGDYPAHLDKVLKSKFGAEFISVFGTGTCGDINHVDVTIKTRRSAGEIGAILGNAIAAAAGKLKPLAAPRLGVRSDKVKWPLREVPEADVADARAQFSKIGTSALPFLKQVEICRTLYLHEMGKTRDLEVQAFRITDDFAIVTLPGEVFVEFGLEIRKTSPFKNTLIIELANDNPAYVPTKKAFIEGSYETVNSSIVPGGGEAMVELAQKLLKELAEQK